MLRERDRLLRLGVRIFDLLLVVLSFYTAYELHTRVIVSLFPFLFSGLYPVRVYSWILGATFPLSFLVLHINGLYKPLRMESPKRILWRILRAVVLLTSLMYIVIYVFLRAFYVSRFFTFLFMVTYLALLILFRLMLLGFLYRIREKGFNWHQILIIGTGQTARDVSEEIENHPFWSFRLLGFIAGSNPCPSIPREQVIGGLGDLDGILKKEVIDEVFVALDEKETVDRERIFQICEKVGVNAYLVPAHYEWQLARSETTSLGRLNLIRFFTVPINPYLLGVKRAVDLAVSSLVLLFFPFLYGVIGALIKLDSAGPVLYRQTRLAHNKRKFYCHKFRTMLKDADSKLELLDAVDETEGPIRKSENDPRITRVGRILRRFSIDEIPQFINVFKGEMSLVGPRPPTPDEVERYEFHHLRRLSVKQGLTGLWQVSGRDAIRHFEDRLKLDLYYIDHWSLWMDLKITAKTVFIIFKGAN